MVAAHGDLLAQALAAMDAKDREAAASYLRALVKAAPPIGDNWLLAARKADQIGEEALAIAAARIFVALKPDEIVRQLGLAHLLLNYGRTEEALAQGLHLVRTFPVTAPHQFVGIALAQLGRNDEALAYLEKTLAAREGAPETWQTMALIKTFDANDIQRMTALEPMIASMSAERQGGLLYALGKAWDDVGEPDRAFDYYERAAHCVASARPYDARGAAAVVDEICADFDQGFLDQWTPSDVPSERPIFVIGLPRSGTTLMEQILNAHSAVKGGGELGFFGMATFELTGQTPSAIRAALRAVPWRENPWRRFGRTYLYFLQERFGDAAHTVDKSVGNSRSVGALSLMLPHARVIWMRRDPLDCALSCFKTRFRRANEWSFSLEAIAHHFRLEDRIHAHWSALLPDQVLTVPYEQMVADPETWIPRVLGHCGLADEPATRTFHLQKRAVQTASLAQVRRPLNASSVGSARKFEARMQPFIQAYRG